METKLEQIAAKAVKQRPKSVVREIRTPRSVGTGGGRPPPVTRWAPSNGCPYRNRTPAESPCKPDALDQVDFGLPLRWLERLLCALLRALLAASPPAQIA